MYACLVTLSYLLLLPRKCEKPRYESNYTALHGDWCRPFTQEAFMRGTERYAAETQLSRRVGAWQNKLEPLMRRQVFVLFVHRS